MPTELKVGVLPSNWNKMSSAERDAIMFKLLIDNKKCIDALITKVSELTSSVTRHSARLDALEKISSRYEQELRDFKELYRAAPRLELKVTGI